jgi:hypothetical protein
MGWSGKEEEKLKIRGGEKVDASREEKLMWPRRKSLGIGRLGWVQYSIQVLVSLE